MRAEHGMRGLNRNDVLPFETYPGSYNDVQRLGGRSHEANRQARSQGEPQRPHEAGWQARSQEEPQRSVPASSVLDADAIRNIVSEAVNDSGLHYFYEPMEHFLI